jgi:hypothetical protein
MINTLNLLTSPRWLAMMPYKGIDKTATQDTIAFNLTTFSLSELSIASNQTGFMGYQVDMPANVRNQDKTVTFNYLMDSKMLQYKFLYQWFSKIAVEDGSGLSPGMQWQDYAFPIRVFILSEFKNPVMMVTYENSWICTLGRIEMTYSDGGAPIIMHNFSVKYSKISFDMNPTFG